MTTQQFDYDGAGRRKVVTDQADNHINYDYDEAGQLQTVTNALQKITQYQYDGNGNRITQIDANTPSRTTRYEYDELDRITKRTLPLLMYETFGYDSVGNRTSRRDFNGRTTTYTYDSMNRLTGKIPDASLNEPSVSFTYTATGQRQTMTDASGPTTYTYDNRDRLKTKVTPQGTLNYTYDAAGNLLTIRSSNANGASVSYTYDDLKRLSTVTDQNLAAGPTIYTYDAVGNSGSVTYPNGVTASYTYDTLNRLINLPITKTSTLASFGYTLGPAGNRLSVLELSGRRADYAYDAVYKLSSEAVSADPGGINGTVGYVHDDVGNRLNRTSSLPGIPAATYSYDTNDRLAADTYDANGNTVASAGKTLTYDFEDRLETMNGSAVTMIYDGDGNRVSKTAGGVTTKYLVDDRNPTGLPQVLEEIVGGSVQRVYTYGQSRISQNQLVGGVWTPSFYSYDGQGSVRLLTNAAGSGTDSYAYDAFGNLIGIVGSTPNVYLYAGEQYDPDLGLYYLRARWYSPVVGRFLTLDPEDGDFRDPLSLHKYLYANGDPIDNSDPTGRLVFAPPPTTTGPAIGNEYLLLVAVIAALAVGTVVTVSVVAPKRVPSLETALIFAGIMAAVLCVFNREVAYAELLPFFGAGGELKKTPCGVEIKKETSTGGESCSKAFPNLLSCADLEGQGFKCRSLADALSKVASYWGRPVEVKNAADPRPGGPIPCSAGKHYSLKWAGGIKDQTYPGSIGCCPCCEEGPPRPSESERCKVLNVNHQPFPGN